MKKLRIFRLICGDGGRPSPNGGVGWFNSADGGPKTTGLNIYKL